MKISKLVCSFVKDHLGRVVFLGCNHFEVENYNRFSHQSHLEKPQLSSQEIYEDKTIQVYCKLCKIAFKSSELNHIVTSTMILHLKKHFNKRGIFKFDSIISHSTDNKTCRICDLCYMLIVADQDLAKAELAMARALAIPEKKEENKMQRL